MARGSKTQTSFKAALAVAAVLGLAACGEAAKEEYKTDVVDESGGDLIVEDADAEGVDVQLPETPMTNAPEEAEGAEDAAAE